MSRPTLADTSIKDSQTYKEKLGRYLNQRIPTKSNAKIDISSLNNLFKSGSSTQLGTLQSLKEINPDNKNDRKMRIEIKSREKPSKKDDETQEIKEKIEKKLRFDEKIKPKIEERKTETLKNLDSIPSQKSPTQLMRARSDNENDKPSRNRGSTPEKKAREESTRPSKPPITFTIRWISSSWPKVEEVIRVDKILGQGSFAKVYQGFDLASKSIVAIKILDKRKISELGFQKMAEKEVEIVQSINHPNICRFEKMLEDKNRVFYAKVDLPCP